MKKIAQSALVICNGEIPSAKKMGELVKKCDFIICADGGANKARKLKITPNLIIGDLDSIEEETKKYYSTIPTVLLQDQHSTDLEKALTYLVNQKFSSAIIVGATGGRIDHTVANFSILAKFQKFLSIIFEDPLFKIYIVKNKIELTVKKGELISLAPLGKCTGVTTKGLKYPLLGETLAIGLREGVSNVATSNKISITIAKGELLLFLQKEDE